MFRRTTMLLTLAGFLLPGHARAADWPAVRPMERSIYVANADSENSGFDASILGSHGAKLYDISCHVPDYNGSAVSFSGLIQCYVWAAGTNYPNLLDDNPQPRSDWANRGRFLPTHLAHPCAGYPDWGSTRRFFFRSMQITIGVSDVKSRRHDFVSSGVVQLSSDAWDRDIKSYRLTVRVVRAKADSSRAAPSRTPRPRWFYCNICTAENRRD